MNNSIQLIRKYITSLPERDIPLGYECLKERDFERLKEIVDSAIYKIKKNLRSATPKEEYLKIDFDTLNLLKMEVDTYVFQSEIEDIFGEYSESEYEDDDEEENYQ